MKIYLDANFFIFAGFDSTKKGNNARSILKEIISRKKQAVTSILALDEVMWVMIKNKVGDRIRKYLEDIYSMPNLSIVSGSSLIPLRAVDFIEIHKLKPRDAFHLAFMQEENLTVIVSDDIDFDKIKGLKRISL